MEVDQAALKDENLKKEENLVVEVEALVEITEEDLEEEKVSAEDKVDLDVEDKLQSLRKKKLSEEMENNWKIFFNFTYIILIYISFCDYFELFVL